jgi:hypothetical protein
VQLLEGHAAGDANASPDQGLYIQQLDPEHRRP